jgi:phage portal protein BeeE
MKILGYEIRKSEQRNIAIGPTTSLGLPWSSANGNLSAFDSMKLSAVYRCVDVKSSDIAAMPRDIYTYTTKSEWLKDDSHFAYSMLNLSANPSCSAFTFWKTLVAAIELNGNGYARIHRKPSGDPISLELITSSVTMWIFDDMTVKYEYIHPFFDANGRTGRLIMNKILMDHGYFPIIIYAKNSRAYHNAIAKGLQRKTKKTYYQFILEQVKKTYDEYFSMMKKY